jgi:Protein of unknown function (DUF1207)
METVDALGDRMRGPGARSPFGVLACALLPLFPFPVSALEPQKELTPPLVEDVAPEEDAPGKVASFFPDGDIYPAYVADPHRTGNGAMLHFYSRSEIASSSGSRTSLKAGGTFGVVRWDPPAPGGRSWQISIDAGLDAMFDSRHKLENIGWDGNYGFFATTASSSSRFAFRLGLLHCSAHVGDEYAERTGRTRIDYSREEVAVGARYRLAPRWSAYGELGAAYKELTEEQAPFRIHGGAEWESLRTILRGRFVWYAALNLALWQERDWRPDVTLQGGLTAKGSSLTWRIGAEYANGRPPLGEFFADTEARFTLGMWADF